MPLTKDWLVEEFKRLLNNTKTEEVILLNKKLDDFFFDNLSTAHESISHTEPELYSKLELEAFSTPYIDYYQVLSDIPRGRSLTDIGGGYGRVCFLSDFLDMSPCISLEKSKERVLYSKLQMESKGFRHSKHFEHDLNKSEICDSHSYYLYFPRCEALDKVLLSLSHMKGSFLYCSESHGDVFDYLDQMSFLKLVGELNTSIPRQNPLIRKYEVIKPPEAIVTLDSLAQWILVNKQRDIVVEITEKHLLLNREVTYLVHISNFEYISYQSKIAGSVINSGRIFIINSNIKYRDLKLDSKYPKDKVINLIKKNMKVFSADGNYYLECNSNLIEI